MEATEVRSVHADPDTRDLDHRLHDMAWGLLLVLTGVVFLVPERRVPEGAWLLGVAGILIGLNAFRFARGVPISGFSMMLGVLALAAGGGRVLGIDLPLLALCLVIIGASIVLRPLMSRSAHQH